MQPDERDLTAVLVGLHEEIAALRAAVAELPAQIGGAVHAALAAPLPPPSAVPPPAATWTDRLAAWLDQEGGCAAIESGAINTCKGIAAAIGLSADALSNGRRKHMGASLSKRGFVAVRVGNEDTYYVRRGKEPRGGGAA